jgi:hypothetical protein
MLSNCIGVVVGFITMPINGKKSVFDRLLMVLLPLFSRGDVKEPTIHKTSAIVNSKFECTCKTRRPDF